MSPQPGKTSNKNPPLPEMSSSSGQKPPLPRMSSLSGLASKEQPTLSQVYGLSQNKSDKIIGNTSICRPNPNNIMCPPTEKSVGVGIHFTAGDYSTKGKTETNKPSGATKSTSQAPADSEEQDSSSKGIRPDRIIIARENVSNRIDEPAGSFNSKNSKKGNQTLNPIPRACWEGNFEVLPISSEIPSQFYTGIQANKSVKAAEQVCEILKRLPEHLKFQMLNRRKVWPEIFYVVPPNKDDIGVYFYPCDNDSAKGMYTLLLKWLDAHDLALQSTVSDVELLIFSSKRLTEDSQCAEEYLWGVFRKIIYRKSLECSPLFNIVSVDNVGASMVGNNADDSDYSSQEIDMEIDMIGGIEIGRTDKPVRKM